MADKKSPLKKGARGCKIAQKKHNPLNPHFLRGINSIGVMV